MKHFVQIALFIVCTAAITLHSTVDGRSLEKLEPSVHRLRPGDGLQYRLQEMLVKAVPGDVIEFGEGRFQLTRQIDIATDNITLRGQVPTRPH